MKIESIDLCKFGEEEACKFLRKQRCKILERNYLTRRGEVDIIAQSGKIVIFVEVKTRSSSAYAAPWESVGFRKRERLRNAAKQYISEHILNGYEFRFDVISITLSDSVKPEIEWLQHAF
ncbi:MAG TPA: YraN family protein [Acidobacteriota bacterium]|nr:YraN family protein [Acidobacteriota bacterium]